MSYAHITSDFPCRIWNSGHSAEPVGDTERNQGPESKPC